MRFILGQRASGHLELGIRSGQRSKWRCRWHHLGRGMSSFRSSKGSYRLNLQLNSGLRILAHWFRFQSGSCANINYYVHTQTTRANKEYSIKYCMPISRQSINRKMENNYICEFKIYLELKLPLGERSTLEKMMGTGVTGASAWRLIGVA